MPFTDGDGVCWLAYIKGVPADRPPRPQGRAILLGRRLRFDAATESRVRIYLPVGSPFLPDADLQGLLDEAQPVQPPARAWPSGDLPVRQHPVLEWATRGGKLARAVLAYCSRRWHQGADRRQTLRRRVRQFVSGVIDGAILRNPGNLLRSASAVKQGGGRPSPAGRLVCLQSCARGLATAAALPAECRW